MALQAAGFVPDAIYGTSAGGAIGAWYAAGQAAQGARTWDSVSDRALLSYRRMLWGDQPVIDFRRLYSDYYPNRFGLDVAALRRAPYPVRVTLTDADTGETLYPDLRGDPDPLALLHATSALPLVSESPVRWQGRRVLDGGLTDPVPLARAIEDGHKEIVLLANRPPGARRPEPDIVVRLLARLLPAMETHARMHHEYHNRAMALAMSPPPGVRVRVVRPASDTGITRLSRDVKQLRRVIERGQRDAQALCGELAAPQ